MGELNSRNGSFFGQVLHWDRNVVVMKKFAINFVLSLIAYLAASAVGLLAWVEILWGRYGGWLFNFLGITRDTSSWISVVVVLGSIVLNTGISLSLFFFVGKRLNLFGKQWLNYLSVCGSLVITVVLGVLHYELLFFAVFPFVMLLVMLNDFFSYGGEGVSIVLTLIMAMLPSIITWLGMLYRSKRPNIRKSTPTKKKDSSN